MDELRAGWANWLAQLTDVEKAQLRDAGIDIGDPLDDGLARFNRLFQQTGGDGVSDDGYDDQKGYFARITEKMVEDAAKPEKKDPAMDFAVFVAARVIDVFAASNSRDVRLHCDCVKLALAYPSCRSQEQICERYNLSKANVSWRVRNIQRKFNLPKGCFNGNRAKS